MNFSFFVSIIRHYMAFETLFFARVLFSAVCFIPLTFLYKRFRITRRDFIGILIPTVLVIYGHEFMMLWGAKYTNPLDASTLATNGADRYARRVVAGFPGTAPLGQDRRYRDWI